MPFSQTLAPATDPRTDDVWAGALATVLAEPERLRLAFQPIVDLTRGVVAGYEALARFDAEPATTPDVWFGAAERLGLAAELEAIAVGRALASRAALPPNCFLSLNVTPPAAMHPAVQAVFAAAGDLGGVVVELTEQVAVDDYDALAMALEPLRAAGALIAVDDAGSGFASLRHVIALRPDFVKVDRELVAGIDRDEAKAAAIEMLGVLASRVDAWIVAEGVEHRDELVRLVQLGIPLGQGYGLGRPGPAMDDLSDAARALTAAVARTDDVASVAVLAEPCPTLLVGSPASSIAQRLLDERASYVALVDDRGRPVAVSAREAVLAGAPPRELSLRVVAGDATADVARRAMTRDPADRFEPIALCDDLGVLVGIVRVERLVAALAG